MDDFFNFIDLLTEKSTWVRVTMVLVGAGLIYLALTRFEMIRWRG